MYTKKDSYLSSVPNTVRSQISIC